MTTYSHSNIYNHKNLESLYKNLNRLVLTVPNFKSETRIGVAHEVLNLSAGTENTLDFVFSDERINRIKYEYAEQFWEFMISGGTDAAEVFEKYPNVAKFIQKPKSKELPENFNTLYGPRIVKQYDGVIRELKNPGSRRASMLILSDEDQVILDKNETIEYPCTIAFHFSIREGKLYLSSLMRSQNLATVFQLDIYLQVRLLHKIAAELGIKPEDTVYHTHLINAHVFEKDFDYVRGFLN